MKNNSILIIEPSSSGLELISAAHALGLHVIVMTLNKNDRIIPSVYLSQVDQVVEIDVIDEEKLFSIAESLNQKNNIMGVLPGFEYYVPLAARLAARLNLPGLPIETVDCLRLKDQMRNKLKIFGVAVPRYIELRSIQDILKIDEQVGYPCVIKPTDGSGSLHVSKVHTREEAESAYIALCQDNYSDMGIQIGSKVLAEEYIAGLEFSVEGYVEENGVHVISITEKILGKEPFFVELGHIVSANLSDAVRSTLCCYTESIVKALNVTLGVFHCEIRLSQKGPIVMELGARLPGDNICELIAHSYQINLAELMIKSYLKQPIQLPKISLKKFSGIRFFTCKNNFLLNKLYILQQLNNLPGFKRCELLENAVTYFPVTHSLGRVAKAIFTHSNYFELKKILETSDELFKFSGKNHEAA